MLRFFIVSLYFLMRDSRLSLSCSESIKFHNMQMSTYHLSLNNLIISLHAIDRHLSVECGIGSYLQPFFSALTFNDHSVISIILLFS